MSTIHEFPKNYERFIAQGEEALVEHNQIAALENFQQAYQATTNAASKPKNCPIIVGNG